MCRSKHVEQLRNIGIINSTTRSHLFGYFYKISQLVVLHGSVCELSILVLHGSVCELSILVLHGSVYELNLLEIRICSVIT